MSEEQKTRNGILLQELSRQIQKISRDIQLIKSDISVLTDKIDIIQSSKNPPKASDDKSNDYVNIGWRIF